MPQHVFAERVPPADTRSPVARTTAHGVPAGYDPLMFRCRLLGHRFRFTSAGATMHWSCARGCGAEGAKTYATSEAAHRYATVFDREDRADLGRRAPLVAGIPLRVFHALRSRGIGPGRRDNSVNKR